MSFQSINNILDTWQNQAEWQGSLHTFQSLLKCWSEIVGTKVASQTRPVSLQRDILSVATSSSAWAQTLTLNRQRLLKQLNQHLGICLIDIRFSTAQWQNVSGDNNLADSQTEHPSRVVRMDCLPPIAEMPAVKDPHSAFQHWAEVVRSRSQQFPLCPQCQCSTPPGELNRWNVCALCATKQWQGHK